MYDVEKLKYWLKDEETASKEYSLAAKNEKNEANKELFQMMSKDEKKHASYIKKMLAKINRN